MPEGTTPATLEEKLSAPDTKAGRLQRACLRLLAEHRRDGAIPTSNRFLFYELLGRRIIPKDYRKADGTKKPRTPAQDVSDALTHLREVGPVPWSWIVDETRTLYEWDYAATVPEYALNDLPSARIDLWQGTPPSLILCESRSLAGVLRNIAHDYLCPIAATNGQSGGFLHTEVGPLVEGGRRVLYLGDLDLSGTQIEENTRKVLEGYGDLEWERLAITDVQVREKELVAVEKKDNRYKPARPYEAVETEALKQQEIQRILRGALEAAVPEPLEEVREREEDQRAEVREALLPLEEGSENGAHGKGIPEFVVDAVADTVEDQIWRSTHKLQGVDYRVRESVRRELRRQVARRLLREER